MLGMNKKALAILMRTKMRPLSPASVSTLSLSLSHVIQIFVDFEGAMNS